MARTFSAWTPFVALPALLLVGASLGTRVQDYRLAQSVPWLVLVVLSLLIRRPLLVIASIVGLCLGLLLDDRAAWLAMIVPWAVCTVVWVRILVASSSLGAGQLAVAVLAFIAIFGAAFLLDLGVGNFANRIPHTFLTNGIEIFHLVYGILVLGGPVVLPARTMPVLLVLQIAAFVNWTLDDFCSLRVLSAFMRNRDDFKDPDMRVGVAFSRSVQQLFGITIPPNKLFNTLLWSAMFMVALGRYVVYKNK
jgi:hypothetical protein